MFDKVLLGGAALLLMGAGARAADIEPVSYDWTGPYIGLQGGYAWGENDVQGNEVLDGGEGLAIQSDPVTPPDNKGSIALEGFVGGLHAGYNYQSDSLVFGLEGDIEYSGMDGDTETPFGEIKQEIDWLGSLRLRAGFAMDRALLYATGGLAVGGVDMKITDVDFGSNSESDTAWGWTIGAGIEYAFTDDLSARLEYRYTDLDNTKLDSTTPEIGDEVKFDNTFNAVRVGLSWHFHSI
ncbi:porin family protein [Nordella sp. HKS 07]|uniref:outer membrane protein n=1 Tax=Nordella sp. HKS 07 TaxID=2712222 RepID=UPI0013E0F4B3|nr:outer membrane protein [Nordella sp. HKS 07]QIG47860.1 porin family protein [Nordella sp. HKS 07]